MRNIFWCIVAKNAEIYLLVCGKLSIHKYSSKLTFAFSPTSAAAAANVAEVDATCKTTKLIDSNAVLI